MSLLSTFIRVTAGDSATVGASVARAASVVLVAACALAGQVSPRFSLGDTRAEVRLAQGAPDVIERLVSQHVEIWSYGRGTVTFDINDGVVVGWNDPTRTLRTALRWARRSNQPQLQLGDRLDDVARLFGTPWAITRHPKTNDLYLAYGRSAVRISPDSVVTGWRRRDAALRVSPMDDSVASAQMDLLAPVRPLTGNAVSLTPAHSGGALPLIVAAREVADADADGHLSLREFADVRIVLRNAGNRPTPTLHGRLTRTRDLQTIAGTLDTFTVAPVPAGGTTQLSFAAYVTSDSTAQAAFVRLTAEGWDAFSFEVPIRTTRRSAPANIGQDLLADLPRPVARNPDAVAVIIGIERYEKLPTARYASSDAQVIKALLTQTLGVPNDALHLSYFTDEQASAGAFARTLGEGGWLQRRASDNSDVLIYFAGHGAPDAKGKVPLLLPFDADASYADATGVALPDLLVRLARLPARSITVFLDACFSGVSRDAQSVAPGSRGAAVSVEHPALLRRNMAVFLACRDGQLALNSPAAAHSLFTIALANGLKGRADTNRDSQLSIFELGQFVETEVAAMAASTNREQRPLLIARDSARVLTRLAP